MAAGWAQGLLWGMGCLTPEMRVTQHCEWQNGLHCTPKGMFVSSILMQGGRGTRRGQVVVTKPLTLAQALATVWDAGALPQGAGPPVPLPSQSQLPGKHQGPAQAAVPATCVGIWAEFLASPSPSWASQESTDRWEDPLPLTNKKISINSK